jgi:hypothetical protein
MKKNSAVLLYAGIFGAGILFFSCATDQYIQVDEAVARGRYADSAVIIERNKEKIYRDPVLYYLDKGMVSHYAGKYDDSIDLLQDAGQSIEEAFTKSVTQEIASYLINDNTTDYAGEDYEDVYISAFNALNYYHKDNIEDALVEIRQMNIKLETLASKYGQITTSLQQEAVQNGGVVPVDSSTTKFTNSALARYLGMLFYRGNGKYDDARIDHDQLKLAFINTPKVYAYPVPISIDEELNIPQGKARLNILCFAGLSPIKIELVERINISSTAWIKIALPFMEERRSEVSKIAVVFDSGTTLNLDLLENMSSIARETFREKLNVIYLKTFLRATMKGIATVGLNEAANQTDDSNIKTALRVASIASQVGTELSEQADLRLSRYFPAKAYIGGITLEPGTYSFSINYYAANGRIISSEKKTMDIQANKLNLVEAICLK